MKEAENSENSQVSADADRPQCFGYLIKVCPRDEEGNFQPQVECLPCPFLKPCLQHGLREQGLILNPYPETLIVSRVSGFLRRWSDRKLADCKPKKDTV